MRFFTIIIIFLFTLFIYNSCAKNIYKVIKEDINIRSDSTISSSIVGKLKKGELIEVLEERFDWYKIRLPKRFFAYVSNEYIKELDNKRARVEASILNLRQEPSLDANVIGKAKNNDILNIIEKQDKWSCVSVYPFGFGWVHKNFLEKLEEKLIKKRGILLFLKKSSSKANFILKTDKGKIPLLIHYKKFEKFKNKKVEIVAKKIDTYFLVKKLKLIK